jgi:hypothetical protein
MKTLPWNPCVAWQDGRHVVFGEIVGDDSMAVVKKIEALQVILVCLVTRHDPARVLVQKDAVGLKCCASWLVAQCIGFAASRSLLGYIRGTDASEAGLHLERSRELFFILLNVLEQRGRGEREREFHGQRVGRWMAGWMMASPPHPVSQSPGACVWFLIAGHLNHVLVCRPMAATSPPRRSRSPSRASSPSKSRVAV